MERTPIIAYRGPSAVATKIVESGETLNTRILLDGIDKDSDRAHLVLEVTAVRFDEL